MTSPQAAVLEFETYEDISELFAQARMVALTLPESQPLTSPRTIDLTVPMVLKISDSCIALTEGMALYGS